MVECEQEERTLFDAELAKSFHQTAGLTAVGVLLAEERSLEAKRGAVSREVVSRKWGNVRKLHKVIAAVLPSLHLCKPHFVRFGRGRRQRFGLPE